MSPTSPSNLFVTPTRPQPPVPVPHVQEVEHKDEEEDEDVMYVMEVTQNRQDDPPTVIPSYRGHKRPFTQMN